MYFFRNAFTIVIAIILLVACASDADQEPQVQEQDEATEEEVQEEVTIQLAHESPDSHAKGIWVDDFKKIAEEMSDGSLRIEVYHQGSLYADEQAALEAVTKGVIQMSIGSTGYISSIEPSFEVFDLPMLFEDQDVLSRALDSPVSQKMLDDLQSKGLKGVGYVISEPLSLFSVEPISSLEDLSGKKIRVHTLLLEETVSALGANPVTIPGDEMYISLQQGMIDGALTTTSFAAPNKFSEVASYMLDAEISAIVYPVVMNYEFWDNLSDEHKEIIVEATKQASEKNREEAAEIKAGHMETLESEGVEISELSAEEREAWIEETKVVYEQFDNQELIEEMRNAGSQ